MPAILNRIDPSKRAQESRIPDEITLPPPSREQRRNSGLLARLMEFGARLNAHGRWMKEFLHGSR